MYKHYSRTKPVLVDGKCLHKEARDRSTWNKPFGNLDGNKVRSSDPNT